MKDDVISDHISRKSESRQFQWIENLLKLC